MGERRVPGATGSFYDVGGSSFGDDDGSRDRFFRPSLKHPPPSVLVNYRSRSYTRLAGNHGINAQNALALAPPISAWQLADCKCADYACPFAQPLSMVLHYIHPMTQKKHGKKAGKACCIPQSLSALESIFDEAWNYKVYLIY